MRMLGALWIVLACAACASGGRGDGPTRPRDAGVRDAALRDTGTPTDAGPDHDGGPGVDAFVPEVDGGRDTGPPDLCASVDCSSLDGDCTAGVCDPSTGTCRAEPRP